MWCFLRFYDSFIIFERCFTWQLWLGMVLGIGLAIFCVKVTVVRGDVREGKHARGKCLTPISEPPLSVGYFYCSFEVWSASCPRQVTKDAFCMRALAERGTASDVSHVNRRKLFLETSSVLERRGDDGTPVSRLLCSIMLLYFCWMFFLPEDSNVKGRDS